MPCSWPRAIVFDFDGLLMDTETTSIQSWQYEWQQWGVTLDASTFFADHGGDTNAQRYAKLAAAAGPGYDKDVSHARRLAYREALHADLDITPGLRDWVKDAATQGIRLAVASSSPREWVTSHLSQAQMLAPFEVIAGGDEVVEHKPAPDVYLLALERLGIDGSEAIGVEDTPHGVRAAQAAGMRCIAIPNPFRRPAEFGHADLVLTSAAHSTLAEALSSLANE